MTAAPPAGHRRLLAPTAMVGTIALSLTAAPSAGAAEPTSLRTQVDADRAAAPRPAAAVSAAAAPATHTVAPGDTLSAIAAAHGLRTADVLTWNGLSWSSIIRPGDVIRLAGTSPQTGDTSAAGYTVRSGDTLWSIASAHGLNVDALRSLNDLGGSDLIHPGQQLRVDQTAEMIPAAAVTEAAGAPTATASSTDSYTVAAGDTMWSIAERHGVAASTLLAANGLQASSIIYPGQRLEIPASSTTGLDAEQTAHAQTIIRVGRERGVPERGIAIALATAMVESWMRNLDWGDRDSLGLFQQRPSAGWGSPAEVRDPARAAAAFYGGPSDPNGAETRGLLDIDGWESMAFTEAAQAVQVSAYPDRYALWEQQAFDWLAALG